jgi:CRP-like cAMP-binding protein
MLARVTIDSTVDTGNALLAALSVSDRQLIDPLLTRRDVAGGERLIEPDRSPAEIFFPETGVIGVDTGLGGARRIDIGLVGRDGFVGWSALLHGDGAGHGATALLQGGTALVADARRLRDACTRSDTLLPGLLRFVDGFVQQLGRTIASTASDPAERRLARWILMLHDKVDGGELAIKHSELGRLLNVRRATITDCLHILEGERALRCSRGRIVVRDRALLAARAGGE